MNFIKKWILGRRARRAYRMCECGHKYCFHFYYSGYCNVRDCACMNFTEQPETTTNPPKEAE